MTEKWHEIDLNRLVQVYFCALKFKQCGSILAFLSSLVWYCSLYLLVSLYKINFEQSQMAIADGVLFMIFIVPDKSDAILK